MTAPRIALVTTAAARALDEDLAPLAAALQAAGAEPALVDWDDARADWSRYDLALLRSPWDYVQRFAEFMTWLERAAVQTRVLNPPAVVRWNVDKHYLGELARAGVAVVPSHYCEPGEDLEGALDAFLDQHAEVAEFVIKPCIGAGSRDAQRHGRADRAAALAHLARLHGGGRSALLQPYLERVDEHGETALIFFEGVFSHAIRKGPLLRRGEGPTAELFAAEAITPRVPSAAERALAEKALTAAASRQPKSLSCNAGEAGTVRGADGGVRETLAQSIPFDSHPLLYARVDLIHDSDGTPRLLELELAEPSLFFEHAPGSASRFAAAMLARLGDGAATGQVLTTPD